MKNKKGISLIVLVPTIIVMLILASAVIITLSNTNIINKAKEAVEKTDNANNKYLSEIKLAEREIEKRQGASKVKDAEGGVLRVENKNTENEIYYIESIDDLVAFSTSVNGGKTYENATVMLTQLLDFNSDKSYVDVTLKETVTTGEGFTPIGTESNPFKGTFDGDGTEIRNLYINIPETSSNYFIGLFGITTDGIIKNVGITGNITTNNGGGVGAIASSLWSEDKESKILNCYSDVQISISTNDTGTVYYAGGIVGDTSPMGAEIKKITIEDCHSSSDIECISPLPNPGGYAGGIAGITLENTVINRCYNTGNIKYMNALNEGEGFIGGIIGDATDTIITNVYNQGNLFGGCYTGGIIGIVENGVKLQNAYNTGNVSDPLAEQSGGIVGYEVGALSLENCYNLGEVAKAEIAGYLSMNVTCTNVYYPSGRKAAIGGSTSSVNINTLTEISLNQMKSQSFVDTLNANIGTNTNWVKWKLGSNGYPVLDM